MKHLILLAPMLLAACAGAAPIDICKGAAVRRAGYTAIIIAADAQAASGRPVPHAIVLGRDAATTALAILDANCPAP